MDSVNISLAKSGVCPICAKFFKGLKIHYNSCFTKANGSLISEPCTVSLNEPSYDFGKQKYKCHLCSSYYKRIDSLVFKKHLRVKHGILNDADYIPLVGKNFFDVSFDNEDDFTTETEWLSNLKKEINGKFNFLLININSILGESKYFSIQTLLQDGFLDMLVVMETKIGVDTPNERFDFNYNIIRRDRQHGSGGLIIFIKKHYKISSVKIHDDFEVLSFVLGINHRLVNFIAGYNPHFEYSLAFNSYIERVLIESNLNHPTFLVGDLNQDLCCSKGDRLRILLSNFGLNMNYCLNLHIIKGRILRVSIFQHVMIQKLFNLFLFILAHSPTISLFTQYVTLTRSCQIQMILRCEFLMKRTYWK